MHSSMQQPPEGFDPRDGRVWLLKKTLYGLRQSPKCWHDKLTSTLTEFWLVPVVQTSAYTSGTWAMTLSF